MKANIEFNLPEDQEQFNVAFKAMDWALLAWSMNQELVRMKKEIEICYDAEGEQNSPMSYDGEGVIEGLNDFMFDIMEEKGLQFPE